jgi:hypothetical protein
MKKEDLTKKQLEEYDMILEINPQWKDKPDKIFAMIKSNAGLLEGFEESEQGQRDDYPDNFRELMNSMVGARDKTEELKDKYGEVGDFVGEEGYLEGKWGDLFNDVESSADTEEDRLRRKIRRLNEERSHVFDDEMGYMEASDPLSYHGQEQKRNLDNMREIERIERVELAEALQRGETGELAGTERTFDNRDLSLVQGNIEGALPEGLQGGLQAQVFDPASVSPYGISQQQIMEALQRSQMPQDQGMDAGTMAAILQAEEQAKQMQMANSGMMQLPSGLRGAFTQGSGGLPGMTRLPGLGGNRGYTGGSTPFNPYGGGSLYG